MKIGKKIEYLLFIILLFFQNFAIIRTEEFGISGLVIFLLIISLIRFKKIYFKISIKYLAFIGVIIGVIVLSAIFNKTLYIMQIAKLIMILWLIYVTYIYIRDIYNEGNQEYFWKLYSKITLIMLLYGIYEFIAIRNSLPLILNIFNNNPSYYVRDVNDYFSGWNDGYRLYNVFFEPSAFSAFIVYNFFFIKENKYIKVGMKRIIYFLIIFNLYFTYARTGWVTMAYMITIYFAYKLLYNKNKILNEVLDMTTFMLPFLNLIIMYFVGLTVFNDLSSLSRTYSGIYYFKNSFDNIKSVILGHGCGSIVNGNIQLVNIGTSAHNGYCDIIYQYGILTFLYLIFKEKDLIKNIKKHRYLIIGILGTLNCFANYYMVETFAALVTIILAFCKMENKQEVKYNEE